ncbi:MAG: hypothetical protein ACLFR8_12895 [Alkalispirochaeta sp.]
MNYQAMAKKVAKQLKAKGKSAMIVRPGSAEGWIQKFDALTGEYYWEDSEGSTVNTDPATPTEIPCSVLENRFLIQHIDGSLVQQDDRLFLSSEQPEVGDELHTDGAVLKVIRVVPLRPADVTIYTEVQTR